MDALTAGSKRDNRPKEDLAGERRNIRNQGVLNRAYLDPSLVLPKGVEKLQDQQLTKNGGIFYTDELNSYERQELCDYKDAPIKYNELTDLGFSDFRSTWSYLTYITTKDKSNPLEKCAIDFYGKFLKHDHVGRVLRKRNENLPEGWICPDNPFKKSTKCEYKPTRNKKERFVRWVSLLNEGRLDFAYSKDEIERNSQHWELQKELDWEFVKPNPQDPKYKEKESDFINRMNQHAGDVLLEIRSKGRIKTDIRKTRAMISDLKKRSRDKSFYDPIDVEIDIKNDDIVITRPPLFFTLRENVNKAIYPINPKKVEKIEYIEKNWKKDQKEKVLQQSSTSEKTILHNHVLKKSSKKDDEKENFQNQVRSVAEQVSFALHSIAKKDTLCGSAKPFTTFSISDSIASRTTNHFNFITSTCQGNYLFMRQFEIEPLFKGWATTQSINQKVHTIGNKDDFIKEYTDPAPDQSLTKHKIPFQDKINQADNTPLIFSLTTGKNMTANFDQEFSSRDIFKSNKESTIFGKKVGSKNDFHQCIVKEVTNEIKKKKMDDFELNGVRVFPVKIETNIGKLQSRKIGRKTFWGMRMDWGVLPTNFDGGHIGTVFNYHHEDGLKDLENFLSKGFYIQNKAMQNCLTK